MAEKGQRQQPGFACEECRRRKARCSREKPCSLCVETGAVCVIIDKKPQRGPRKGQLNAMRSHIASLQWQLNQQVSYETDSAPGRSGQITPEREYDGEQVSLATEVDSGELGLGGVNDADLDLSVTCVSTSAAAVGMTPTATSSATSAATSAATSSASETAPLNLELTDWAADWRPEELRWTDWAADWRPDNNLGLGMGLVSQKLQLPPPDNNMDMTDQHPSLHVHEPSVSSSITDPITLADNGDTTITAHMRADLDQVFFDRVHAVLPIIYRRRYFSWAGQESPGAARACLRSAVRTMAAAMSAPGGHFCDQLYAETCRLLQAYTLGSKDKIVLEYIQAWLLLGYYELLRVAEYQAMLTAGRCFRLVLMARLSDIDAPGPDNVNLHHVSPVGTGMDEDDLWESFSAVEEQRRTFWLAFCLDRFLCSRNDYPLTLHEEMASSPLKRKNEEEHRRALVADKRHVSQICTRLPAPEANFQNNQRTRTSFLPEAMSASQQGPSLSPFAECIVLATLHGRCMAHRRSYTTKDSHGGGEGGDFWTRQKRLAAAVEGRVQVLLGTSSSVQHVDSDPMLLFAHMLAHSAVVKLGHTAQRAASAWRTAEQQGATAAYERRAAAAAAEMVRLAKQVPSFSCFKAHPFLPDPLACAASFLNARGGHVAHADDVGVQHLLRLLRDMQGMNSLARGYFQ